MFLNRFRLFVALLAPIALLALATPSRANSIGSASGTVTCTSYSLSFNLLDLDYYNTHDRLHSDTNPDRGGKSGRHQ